VGLGGGGAAAAEGGGEGIYQFSFLFLETLKQRQDFNNILHEVNKVRNSKLVKSIDHYDGEVTASILNHKSAIIQRIANAPILKDLIDSHFKKIGSSNHSLLVAEVVTTKPGKGRQVPHVDHIVDDVYLIMIALTPMFRTTRFDAGRYTKSLPRSYGVAPHLEQLTSILKRFPIDLDYPKANALYDIDVGHAYGWPGDLKHWGPDNDRDYKRQGLLLTFGTHNTQFDKEFAGTPWYFAQLKYGGASLAHLAVIYTWQLKHNHNVTAHYDKNYLDTFRRAFPGGFNDVSRILNSQLTSISDVIVTSTAVYRLFRGRTADQYGAPIYAAEKKWSAVKGHFTLTSVTLNDPINGPLLVNTAKGIKIWVTLL
jgi:hypothetical protein